jgi:DNA-binding NarL/FixJ family response regulator
MLVSGQGIIRAGLRKLLEHLPWMMVVHEAESCAAALAAGEQPDVILFDCDFCGDNCPASFPYTSDCAKSPGCADTCFDALHKLLAATGGARALILTAARKPALYHQFISIGAMGLVFKEEPAEVLYKAIEKVHAGEFWLNRLAVANMLSDMCPPARPRDEDDPEAAKVATLTGREREVILLVGEGLKNKQMAERLFISKETVHHHLTTIYDKLGVSSRLELIIYAYRHGLAKLPAPSGPPACPGQRPSL